MSEKIIPDTKTEVVASRLLHEIIGDKTDKLIRVSDAAERSSVSPKYIHEAIRAGTLKAVNFGGTKIRIYESDLLKWWRSLENA